MVVSAGSGAEEDGSSSAAEAQARARRESYVARALGHVARARLDQAVARLPNPGQEFEMRCSSKPVALLSAVLHGQSAPACS